MTVRVFKYCSPFLLYLSAALSLYSSGIVVWLPLLYAWFLLPLIEIFSRPDTSNLSEAEEEVAKKSRAYDLILYLVVPIQYIFLVVFLYQVGFVPQPWPDLLGKTFVMGLLCGVMGINVAHELGHRVNPLEQFLAKCLLLTSMYMHFFIEHNKGHHKRVATPEDPSSARLGETLYSFYFRSIIFSYADAWRIAAREAGKRGRSASSIHNEMIVFQLLQISLLIMIWIVAGPLATFLFAIAACQGVLLLETVNYIEHYGLQRAQLPNGKYERAMPVHSWNSNHVLGRLMLFELSRHSDHHYLASRKYQVLRHHGDSPQMPTGYPGMMLLATIPPLWFRVMNKRVRSIEKDTGKVLRGLPA